MSFQTIRQAIKTILETIDKIAYVYDYHESNITGYPAITFDVSEVESDFMTTSENLRVYAFEIVLYQSMLNIGIDEANRILDNAADDVIQTLEENLTLNNTVDFATPVIGARDTIETPNGLVRIQQLALRTKTSFVV